MAITRLNSLAIPAGTVEPADISYPLTDFSSTGIDDNASNTAITIDSTGHVKVGNTAASPDGTISIRSDSDSHAISIYEPVGANENWQIGVDVDGDLGFYDSGSTTASITFADGGNVGIGETNPSDSKLHVYKNNDGEEVLARFQNRQNLSSNTAASISIQADQAEARIRVDRDGAGTSASLIFSTASAGTLGDRMTISPSGNVGIGVSDPDYRLDVSPTVQIVNSSAGLLRFKRDDTVTSTGNGIGQIQAITNEGGTDAVVALMRFEVGDTPGTDGEITFETGLTERLRIDSNGNVGIGTTSPNGTLHVQKTTSELNINSANNFANRIAPVIIGDGDGVDVAILIDGNQIEQAAESNSLYLNYNSSATTIINVGGGNVAIGRTNPQELLHIEGGAIVSAPVSYAQNQDQPYLIAASANYTGANTHWGTYGIQHRVKTNSGGTPRITVDTVNGEVFSLDPNGNMNLPLGEIQDVGTVTSRGVFRGTTTTGGGTPTFSFDGDTDTGIYHVTTDTLGLTTGGSVAVAINSVNRMESYAAGGNATLRNVQQQTVANNGTVDFPQFSGMIIVNSISGGSGGGDAAIWMVGSGSATRIGSSTGITIGSMAYNSGVAGYRFTNNTGSSRVFSFMAFDTRGTA